MTEVLVAVEGPVATITLNRPEALNAITVGMLGELREAITGLGAEIAVAVLTGAGRAFSAGVDLKALGDRSLDNGMVGDLLDLPARAVVDAVAAAPQIVVAKVNGACFTGALELALACDIAVTANEAVLGDTHAKWGLRPTWGMSQRLPHLAGAARARLLSYTARTFSGLQAAEWGIVAASHPREGLDAAVADLAAQIAANSRGSLAAYKDLFRAAERLPLPEGLAYEAATAYPITDTDQRIAAFRR